MEFIFDIFDFLFGHSKLVITAIIALIIGYAVSTFMTDKSVRYEPVDFAGSSINSDVSYNYDKSTGISESYSIESELMGAAGETNESMSDLNEINDAYSKLRDASGKAGILAIPAGASYISANGTDVYLWKKEYKIFFDLIPGEAIEGVVISDNIALEGKLEVSSGVLAETTAYQLE